MLVIGNDELDRSTPLGNTIQCWICGKRHRVKYGQKKNPDTGELEDSKLLAFFNCGGKSYLCGINGREIRPE